MTLQPGEIGGHILLDWGKVNGSTPCGVANCNIDVVNMWKENEMWEDYGDTAPKNALWLGAAGVPPATDAVWRLVSSDVNGDSINSSPMIDGPFIGSYANFNYKQDIIIEGCALYGLETDPDTGDCIVETETSPVTSSMNLIHMLCYLCILLFRKNITDSRHNKLKMCIQ
jgi:hypothetical protein